MIKFLCFREDPWLLDHGALVDLNVSGSTRGNAEVCFVFQGLQVRCLCLVRYPLTPGESFWPLDPCLAEPVMSLRVTHIFGQQVCLNMVQIVFLPTLFDQPPGKEVDVEL